MLARARALGEEDGAALRRADEARAQERHEVGPARAPARGLRAAATPGGVAVRDLLGEPASRDLLAAALRRSLGGPATVSDTDDGGLLARASDGRVVDASVVALVDRALGDARPGAAVDRPVTPGRLVPGSTVPWSRSRGWSAWRCPSSSRSAQIGVPGRWSCDPGGDRDRAGLRVHRRAGRGRPGRGARPPAVRTARARACSAGCSTGCCARCRSAPTWLAPDGRPRDATGSWDWQPRRRPWGPR